MAEVQPRKGTFLSIRWKLILIFTLLFSIIFAGVTYGLFVVASRNATDEIERDLQALAEWAASGIDGDAHESLYTDADVQGPSRQENPDDPALEEEYHGIEDERYRELVDWLVTITRSRGRVDSDGDGVADTKRVFAYTYTLPPERRNSYSRAELANVAEVPVVVDLVGSSEVVEDKWGGTLREPFTPQSPEMRLGLLERTSNVRNAVSDEFGTWYSAFAPIENSDGEIVGAVGVDLRDNTLVELRTSILQAALLSFPVTFIVTLGLVALVSYNISKPIISLTAAAEKVAEGDYTLLDVLPDHKRALPDETAVLSDVFEIMVDKVRAREEKLKQQVAELKIMIDEGKKQQQVDEIVDSEFFRDLQQKARQMRERRQDAETGEPSAAAGKD